jgi:pyrimidine operon attenuation protein/uracil phosphoribosyltransferase
MPDPAIVMSAAEIAAALDAIAGQIVASEGDVANLVLVGIPRGGVPLARRLATRLETLAGQPVPAGSVDIGMHRDDLSQRAAPDIHPTVIPCDITGRTVVLVDDVLFRGRSARAAMDALHDFGRPGRIRLATLIDRGHRELPIQPDYVGRKLPTRPGQTVRVTLAEEGGVDEARVEG